ncbi:galactoside alpha-(1,2)-fucosyltransferase 2-like isoform X2 [Palaemon carinicauda]|uniref:galactoside alpha-(1,2)-fucosyltransferase 2-like isoform X2 n=1 Tax=Palaemon carinicauda TaxID=392227 RepID=UPI0035B63330
MTSIKDYLRSPKHLLIFSMWMTIVPSIFLYCYYSGDATQISFLQIHNNKFLFNSLNKLKSRNVSKTKETGLIPYRNQTKSPLENTGGNTMSSTSVEPMAGRPLGKPIDVTGKNNVSSNNKLTPVTTTSLLVQNKTTSSKTTIQPRIFKNTTVKDSRAYTARFNVSAKPKNLKSKRITGNRQDHSNMSVNCSEVWVSSHIAGRLGNQMCEYAHLLTLHLNYGIQVGLLPPMHRALSKIFPNLSARLLPKKCTEDTIKTSDWHNVHLLVMKKKLLHPIIIGGYPCNASILWHHRATWRREFTFASGIAKKARKEIQSTLKNWKIINGLNRTLKPLVIGVHVRRSDYISYLKQTTGGKVLGAEYFQRAFQFFREKYRNVVFLVASDDRRWCNRMLLNNETRDVIITPKASATDDLALLSYSSHFVMSVGTYGFWAGVLSGGLVTFPLKVGGRSEYFMTKNLRSIKSKDLIPIKL